MKRRNMNAFKEAYHHVIYVTLLHKIPTKSLSIQTYTCPVILSQNV